MATKSKERSVIIIGAGFAGFAAGIYARINGYDTTIFEMHNQPGGLCTSWQRKGYTFDGCIHWLVGSSPGSGMHDMWEETGIAQGREFINLDEYCRIEGSDGRTLVFHTDIDRLEKHLLEFSPADEKPIMEFIKGIRMCIPFDTPSKHDSLFAGIRKRFRSTMTFIVNGRKMQEWMNTPAQSFAARFKDPMLRDAFMNIWVPEFSMFFMLFTFAYLHNRNAGYPIGGSKPMSKALEERYLGLGGIINYKKRVSKILTEGNKAVGVLLEDGTVHNAARVISAADGHATIFDMLDGRYGDARTREPYEKWPVFYPLVFISLGVKRTFNDVPMTVSGLSYRLKEPLMLGEKIRDTISAHIYNHDPSMAPEGSTAITVMYETDYEYWKSLAQDKDAYKAKKEETGAIIVKMLEQRFPGITEQVEVIDVATPMTFERYTGNWKGSFEGWLITPENARVLMKPMSQTLPGLSNFYMCGQWVEPGGGLPTAIMSGIRLIKSICREDGRKFVK